MLLSIENLGVSYDNIKALHGLDFQVDEGEIVCIIGANGAGKSTTLRAISRLVPVDAGSKMTFMGKDLLEYNADKVVSELGISHAPEGRRLFGNLTVMENLRLAAYARKDGRQVNQDIEWVFSIFPRLEERMYQRSGTLSGGEQQMLAVGRALVSGRKVMLLDEPSMGLAPLLMMDVFKVMDEINEKGTTILLVEQNARMALQFAQRGYVLESGNLVLKLSRRAVGSRWLRGLGRLGWGDDPRDRHAIARSIDDITRALEARDPGATEEAVRRLLRQRRARLLAALDDPATVLRLAPPPCSDDRTNPRAPRRTP